MTLTEFLLARIAEDEAAAKAAAPGPWTYSDIESVAGGTLYDPTVAIANIEYDVESVDPHIRRFRFEEQADATGEHIARHDPARVLVDCTAKRAIMAQHEHVPGCGCLHNDQGHQFGCSTCHLDEGYVLSCGWCPTLRLLALPYAAHPDYDEAWRVDL